MAGNSVTIEAKLNEQGVVSGAKKIKVSLEEIKRADGSLSWSGVKEGGDAAKRSDEGFTVLKGTLANLATAGIAAAAGAIKSLGAQVVEIGSAFETSMSKVGALSGATGDDLAALEAKARELGASTTFSASQAADALGYMALAGWDTQQMLDGVGSVLTLAQAGEMDLAAASDLVTDYLSAFSMEAAETSRMVDVLAYAQANANTTVEGLGMAFKNCAANANAAGMDVETTSAAISMMANQGLKGSEAGTALNAVLRDMTAKMEDGCIAIGKQSIAVMDAEGNYRDFTDILRDVQDATNGMGDAEKAAALQSTFTADSIKGLNLMLNAGADEMVGFREELYGCAGTAEATAAVMTDNLGGDLAALGSAMEELALKVYERLQEPLRALVQFVTNKVVPIGAVLIEHIREVAAAIGVLGGALAVAKWKHVANFIGRFPAVVSVLKMFTGPLGLIVAALGALSAAFAAAYNASEPFREAIGKLGDALGEVFGVLGTVLDRLGRSFEATFSGILGGIDPLDAFCAFVEGTVVPAIESLASFISESVVPALDMFIEDVADFAIPALGELAEFVIGNVIPALLELWTWVGENVVPVLAQLAAFIADTVVTALSGLWDWFCTKVIPILQDFAAFVTGTVVPALGQMWQWIQANVIPVLEGLWQFVSSHVIPAMQDLARFLMEKVVPALSSLFSWVGANVLPVLSSFVGFVIGNVVPALQSMWEWFSANILPILSSFAAFILDNVVPALETIWDWFTGSIIPVLGDAWEAIGAGIDKFAEFAEGVARFIGDAKDTIQGGIDAIVGFFAGMRIELPHINLPHFVVSGEFNLDPAHFSIPHIGVEWYAKGGIFNGPSVIGIGEAGAEAVLPLTNRQAMRDVGQAVASAGGMGGDDAAAEIRALRRDVARLADAMGDLRIVWNRREVARAVRDSEGCI